MINLNNKNVIITGATKGIGKQISISLAEAGCNLYLISRSLKNLKIVKSDIEKKYKVKVKCFALDISDLESTKIIFDKIIEENKNIDILINNAGITKDNILVRMSKEDWDDVINTNLTGTFNCCKSIIKQMIKQRYGKIINISSIIGISGNSGQINYSASKAGIISLTKSLAQEVGSRNININAIAPGFIETEMTNNLNEDTKDKFLNSISLKRFGSTKDIANLVCFLASDLSSYITGQTIVIDGGIK
tara:strand:+ start:941 stop:1684 length:744 start_codon:yes stop_codon:yes gene_type:complete